MAFGNAPGQGLLDTIAQYLAGAYLSAAHMARAADAVIERWWLWHDPVITRCGGMSAAGGS